MDLSHQEDKRTLRLFPEPKKSCREGTTKKDQVPAISWWKIILFRPIQLLFATDGNSDRIFLQIHTGTNHVAERKNRFIVEATWGMLEECRI